MVTYQLAEGPLPQEFTAAVKALYGRIFEADNSDEIADELQERPGVCCVLALVEGQPVGFKLGYRRKPGHFYSWLGGVVPEMRGRGIGATLMKQQHAWCRANGYESIRTQTLNRWKSMLILNLRHGFEITGVIASHGAPLKLVLEKRL